MADTRPEADTCTLWGGALSLYTGKVRSYLIKKGVPYREFYASHPDFQARIRPVVGLGVTPVLETPDGDILQDSTEIIEAMERRLPDRSMIPATPVLRALAWLLDAYGSEHLLAMAMHFRWAEPHITLQRSFLQAEFGRASYLGTDKVARDQAGARMVNYFSSMLGPLGSNARTAGAIEAEFVDLLDVLDEHFQHGPYLLGGHPSLADFGFIAPLFAHLGRDPSPSQRLRLRAPNVARWIERMNLAAIPDGEFPDVPAAFDAEDRVPPTLLPLLALIFRDWTPELLANAQAFNAWATAHPELNEGAFVALDGRKRVHPHVGPIAYHWRGCTVERVSAPQTLWHFGRFQQQLLACDGEARDRLFRLLEQAGGSEACALKLVRPIERRHYGLVLGPP